MGVGLASLFLLYLFLVFLFFSHTRKFTSIYIYKNIKNTIRNPKKLLECHCIGKRLKYPLNFSKKFENAPGGACGSRAVTVGGGKLFWRGFRSTNG
jgi:hypothetical protein